MAGKPVKRAYSTAEVERGLIAVAFANGNARQASDDLAKDGLKIPDTTLYPWSRRSKVAQYKGVRREVVPKLRQAAADAHRALAEKQIRTSSEAVDLLRSQLQDIPARDLSTAVRNLDVGSAVYTDKAQLLEDEPTAIEVKRTLPDVLRALKAKGIDLMPEYVDAEAVEVETNSSETRASGGRDGKRLGAGATSSAER